MGGQGPCSEDVPSEQGGWTVLGISKEGTGHTESPFSDCDQSLEVSREEGAGVEKRGVAIPVVSPDCS